MSGRQPLRATWVVLLQRSAPDAVYQAAAMAASAVSLGINVTIVWFDAALEMLAAGRLGLADEDGSGRTSGGTGRDGRPGTLDAAGLLLREARETGRLRFLACSASVLAAPAGIEEARARVDDVVGWPTVIGLLRASEKSFVW